MIDTAGKVLETIIGRRLERYTEGDWKLDPIKFGFRIGRSIVDTTDTVTNIAKIALDGSRWEWGSKQYFVVITLDIKNAFNSAKWKLIIKALKELNVPNYLF